MSGKEKKRHVRELLAILCVAVFLAAGVWYLKDQREKRERDASVSEESQKLQEQEEMTASSEMIQDSENQDREEQESQEQKSMVTPTAAPETTAEPELTEEEKSGGVYRGISWADSVGDQIIVCQMDAIEVKDAAGQTVRSFSDLGRLSRGSDTVYTNGFYVWYAAASEDGTTAVWQLDLETGDKKAVLELGERDTFVGVNSEYLYYIVPGADEFENTLKASRINDGTVLDITDHVGEVTVLSDTVITMGLRFDVSPTEMKVFSADGSNPVTVGSYVSNCQVKDDRIYYLDYGSEEGYLPSDLKSCSLSGQDIRVLAEDLYTIAVNPAGENMVYFASEETGSGNSGTEYVLLNYETGEKKTVAEGGSYIQFLCSDGNRVYLGKENQIAVYDFAGGQMRENIASAPENSYTAGGFLMDGTFYAVWQSSDNQVEVVPVEGV